MTATQSSARSASPPNDPGLDRSAPAPGDAQRRARRRRSRAIRALLDTLPKPYVPPGAKPPLPTIAQKRLAEAIVDLDMLITALAADAWASPRRLGRHPGLSTAAERLQQLNGQRATLVAQFVGKVRR